MLQAMYNGVSALEANQQTMDVIGNNIANVNTTAYKASTVSFQDQLSQTIQGASQGNGSTVGGTNPMQVGLGVKVGSIGVNMEQGGLESTSSPTNLAIQGNGYFMLGDGSNGDVQYTRDGTFSLDSQGNLVDAATGQYVLGWEADTGTGQVDTTTQISGNSHLSIPVGSLTSVYPTSTATFGGNLSSDTAAETTPSSSDYNRSVKVYDSLGDPHNVTLTFTKTADNTWSWAATGDPSDSTAAVSGSGTITFDTNGNEIPAQSSGTISLATSDGSTTPQTITPDFSQVTQVSGASSAAASAQNGFGPGTLSSFTIDNTGMITGDFNNGQTRVLGQIAMANFANPEGLSSSGSNNFQSTINSGIAEVGTATQNGLGQISTGYLEQSNVDLSNEFSNMIISQNGYEANTKIVTTVDQMLKDVIGMVQ